LPQELAQLRSIGDAAIHAGAVPQALLSNSATGGALMLAPYECWTGWRLYPAGRACEGIRRNDLTRHASAAGL
jgi:hypothetical protein